MSIQGKQVTGVVNPLVFGVNTLFMYDDDAALADGKIAEELRAMPCHLIRFPGGDVADNYHWKTGNVDDPAWWPKVGGPTTTDTDEFMRFCRKVGAEPMFVVNIESGFVHGNLQDAVREAAEWVAYCKAKDYRVHYWEIGNETYLYNPGKHKRARVTAADYARAFVQFAGAMKQVDPTIQCGAVGPQAEDTSSNNRLPDGGLANPPEPPWWPTVWPIAGPQMDFMVVHDYSAGRGLNAATYPGKRLKNGAGLERLKQAAHQATGRALPLALTEWNLSRDAPQGMVGAQMQAEALCRFLNAGVDMATIWPLRFPGGDGRGVLDWKDKTPLLAWQVLHLFSAHALPHIVQSAGDQPSLLVLATASADTRSLAVFLVNKAASRELREVTFDLGEFKAQAAHGTALVATATDTRDGRTIPIEVVGEGSRWKCSLPPQSIGVVTFGP